VVTDTTCRAGNRSAILLVVRRCAESVSRARCREQRERTNPVQEGERAREQSWVR
jgi:hypothetical protein